MKRGKTAVIAGGLAAVTLGAIALSSRTAKAKNGAPGGAVIDPVGFDVAAPTTGDESMVRAGLEGILSAIPDATLDQYVLGSLDNAVSLVEAKGVEGMLAVYEPDDVSAIYQAVEAVGQDDPEALDAAAGLAVSANLIDESGAVVIPTGRSLWLDQGFNLPEGRRVLDPIVQRFLAAQAGAFA